MKKKGQVTLFIILAIVIVVIGVLIYAFYPQIQSTISSETENPFVFIEDCLENKIEETAIDLSLNGGSLEPENTYKYEDQDLEYLCYTNTYYELCDVQQPFLRKHIQEEIKTSIESNVGECFASLKENYEASGNSVQIKEGDFTVELLPGKIVTKIFNEVTITKDSSQKYDRFDIILNNNLYQLVAIASSITEWEATYGEADTLSYMMLYPELKVEKYKQSDETKIYIITDKNTGIKFQFASRSVAFPPGY